MRPRGWDAESPVHGEVISMKRDGKVRRKCKVVERE